MKTIRDEVGLDAKFLTKRWGGELIESDLEIALISARENQREADCNVLCSYCNSDGYAPAVRYATDSWRHTATRDGYLPEDAFCEASRIREMWFCSFAPTAEQIAKECAESIVQDTMERQGFDGLWNDIKPDALEEIRSDWANIIKTAIERYQREGAR